MGEITQQPIGRVFPKFQERLSQDGLGTDFDMAQDFSSEVTEYVITPSAAAGGVAYCVQEVRVQVSDAGNTNVLKYGSLAQLTNGIRFLHRRADGSETYLDAGLIKDFSGWARITQESILYNLGGNPKLVVHHVNAEHIWGAVIRLLPGDGLVIQLNDDLSGLSLHAAVASGYVEGA
jgi:hypothetical protein